MSELGQAQLREVVASQSLPDAVRQDVDLLAAIARVWGEDAIRQLQFAEMAAPPADVRVLEPAARHPRAGESGHARRAVTRGRGLEIRADIDRAYSDVVSRTRSRRCSRCESLDARAASS